jgi:hypothetical protein
MISLATKIVLAESTNGQWSSQCLWPILRKRNTIKSQILANFVVEWMEPNSYSESVVPELPWLMYCDGTWGSTETGAAAVLISPSTIKLCYAARLQFTSKVDKCMNNNAKYEAILLGLHKFIAIGVQRCVLRIDSKVVSGQIEKECFARE